MDASENMWSAVSINERRLRIDHFIEASQPTAGSLREIQDDIDVLRAVAGTPNLALEGVLGHLSNHISSLLFALQYYQTELAKDGRDFPDIEDAVADLGDIITEVGRVRGRISTPTKPV